MQKLGVVGSRNFDDYTLVKESLEPLLGLFPITTIVSGGARGADRLGEKFAKEYNLQMEVYKPQADSYYAFARAAKERNIEIVKASDIVVAFWDGISTGTKHTIDVCRAFKKQCIIIPTNHD